jgi:hypothetical protein
MIFFFFFSRPAAVHTSSCLCRYSFSSCAVSSRRFFLSLLCWWRRECAPVSSLHVAAAPISCGHGQQANHCKGHAFELIAIGTAQKWIFDNPLVCIEIGQSQPSFHFFLCLRTFWSRQDWNKFWHGQLQFKRLYAKHAPLALWTQMHPIPTLLCNKPGSAIHAEHNKVECLWIIERKALLEENLGYVRQAVQIGLNGLCEMNPATAQL